MDTVRLCIFLILSLILLLQFYYTLYDYTLYHFTRIGIRLRGIQYLAKSTIMRQTANYQVEGSAPITSKGIQCVPVDTR